MALAFKDSFEFILEAHKNNLNVLVHCVQGKSRSASCVIHYLMLSRGIALAEALSLVTSTRRIAMPNAGFMRQLKEFEIARQEKKGYID